MASEIRANTLKNRVGLGTVSFTNTGPVVSGIITATGADINGDIDVDGHTNLDNVSISGITTASTINSTGNIEIDVDNGEFRCGAGGDFKISHNGSLNILRSDFPTVFRNAANNQTLALFTPNGAVNLYHSNGLKFSTTSSGISIDGNISATGNLTPNGTLYLTDAIEHTDDSNTKIRFPAADTITAETSGNERLRIDSNGRIGLGIANPDAYFSSYNRVVMGRTNDTGGMTIVSAPTSGGYISFADGTSGNQAYRGMISYYHNIDALAFNTAATERVRIDSSGAVRINNTRTTATKLHVVGGTASGTAYDAAVFAGGQNSTSGSGVKLYLSGCENDPISRGVILESIMTDNANAHRFSILVGGSSAAPIERFRITPSGAHFYGNQSNLPSGIFGFRYDKNNDTDLSIENLNNSSVNNNAGIRLATNHSNIKFRYFNNGGFYISNASTSGYLHYYEGSDSRLYIDTSGNISINNAATPPSSNGALGKRLGIKSTANNVIIGETTQSGNGYGLQIESRQTGRSGDARIAQIGLKNDASGNGQISFFTAPSGADVSERMTITSNGQIGLSGSPTHKLEIFNAADTENILMIRGADNTTEYAAMGVSGGNAIITGGGVGSTNAGLVFRTADGGNEDERLRIDKNGSLTNTTNSTHSQGAGTFNIKGVINQYSQGSGSGLIFDCDFGRLTGYGDDTNVGNGTNLSACLAHSTTDWSSSNSNTPISVNNGTFQYRVGFGGYMEGISNGGRVSVAAGSGSPNMASTLNTASMTIETWVWYDNGGREVIASRWGSGFPDQFNMICDPDGQFHYNSNGVGAGSGNISGEHFPAKTWHHHLWQYDSGSNVHRWYINGAFVNSRSHGSSLAVSSSTGFGIFSRGDDYERWRGKIAIVRIYNRALSAAEIKNHFELERGRFGV